MNRDAQGRFTRRIPLTVVPVQTNHIGVVLDSTGSMAELSKMVVGKYNQLVNQIKLEAQRTGQPTTLTLVLLGSELGGWQPSRVLFAGKPINSVGPLTYKEYWINAGRTALYEATSMAIHAMQEVASGLDADHTGFLLTVITDGYNNSGRISESDFAAFVATKQATGRWTITFSLPVGNRSGFASRIGIPLDNIQEWETTKKGLAISTQSNMGGTQSYFNSRATGATSTTSFYKVDLAKAKPTKLARAADIVTSNYHHWRVLKEVGIEDFILARLGTYTRGNGFYQITKPEKVQSYKSILIRDKTTKVIYGGEGVREFIGLPFGKDIKLDPFNLGGFEVFVQSTSTNRKLVRGTVVLYKK